MSYKYIQQATNERLHQRLNRAPRALHRHQYSMRWSSGHKGCMCLFEIWRLEADILYLQYRLLVDAMIIMYRHVYSIQTLPFNCEHMQSCTMI